MRRAVHHVSRTMHSDLAGTDDFRRVADLANRLEKYARRLGFDVVSDNVDTDEAPA